MNGNFAKKWISALFIMVMLMTVFMPTQVQAKTSNESNVKKVVKYMNSYEYAVLNTLSLEVGKSKTIKLSATEKARASALAVDTSKATWKEYDEESEFCTITDKNMKKCSKILFGESIGAGKLQKKTQSFLYDAINKNGKATVIATVLETEVDFNVISTKVKTSGKNYVVTKNVYYGYWGANDGTANYQIIYELKKNKNATNGYSISSMKIKKVK